MEKFELFRISKLLGVRKKWLIAMKTFVLLFFAFSLQLNASVFSQRVSLNLKDVSAKDLIREIESQTNLGFIYNLDEIEKLDGISIDAKEETVKEVLDEVLKGTDLTYEIDKEVIVIKPRPAVVEEQEQQKPTVIKGKVTDKSGTPIPGVTVMIEGTYNGTATNADGMFSLNSPKRKGVLMVSSVGFKAKKVVFDGGKPLMIALEEDVSKLDEVSVVAYGTTTKREMVGSVASVKGEALKNVPVSNIATALQGRIAGMDIQNMSGAPGGGGVSTVVRGYNSLDSETRNFSAPLWVIDGIPVSNMQSGMTGTNALAEIDPSMIESIEVLKDASAASLYGSRAANGVILVTTKKGRPGKTKFSANVSTSYSFVPKFPTVTAGVEARRFKEEALRKARNAGFDDDKNVAIYPDSHYEAWKMRQDGMYNSGYDFYWGNGSVWGVPDVVRLQQDSLNSFYNNSTNWFDIMFQAGKVVDANVQARGGNENMNFNIGIGYYSEDGIMKNSGFDRGTMLASLNFKPTKRATIDFRVFSSISSRKKTSNGTTIETVPTAPFEYSPFLPGKGSVVESTLLQSITGVKQKNHDFRLRANFSVLYNLTKGLDFKSMNSIDYSVSKFNRFTPSFLNTEGFSSSYGGMSDFTNMLSENILTYNTSINELHNIDILAGFSYQTDKQTSYNGYGNNSPSDYINYVTGGFPYVDVSQGYNRQMMQYQSDFSESILVSGLARVKYNYNKKYLFEASIRRDGSSKFGKAIPWGTFPSASAGWVFSEENFMNFLPKMDFGKIRASWGVSGMQFDQAYLAYGLLSTGTVPFRGNSILSADERYGLLNDKLSWEETTQYNLGLDLDFFNYKLGVIFDYYYRYTDKLLYNVDLPGNYSYFSGQAMNAAAISNEGMELTIKWDVIRNDELTWKMNFNIARNWNQFRASYDDRDISRRYTIGKPVNGIYALRTDGIISDASNLPYRYSTDGTKYFFNAGNKSQVYTVGDTRYLDFNGDAEIDHQDEVYLGSPLPKAFGGLLNEIKWKNFDVNFLLSYSLGRTIINGTLPTTLSVTQDNISFPILADLNDYTFWEKPGDETDYPRNELDTRGNNIVVSDRFVEQNVHYVKLKNLIVGYKLPKHITNKIGISGARVFVSGENLFTITNYTGADPETVNVTTGIDLGNNYPLTRKFTAGLTVNF
ncbi:SusC/RagA family TonB-linked outer membrane protein [Marinifilum breve]|nr:SusC/RagA family TonB-linked outer membrane protein [Marinifilum breve]